MKIKQQKQLNLPQLIEWAWDNGVRNVTFRGLDKKSYVVSISVNDKGEFLSDWRISKDSLFTVEVETEITENTVIPKMVSIGRKNENEINIHYYCRISQFIDNKDFNYYILNDDDTLTLIWCDGKLVE